MKLNTSDSPKFNCKPYAWLILGLVIFFGLADFFEKQVVFIGRKNLILISVVPFVISMYYKHLLILYRQPKSFQPVVIMVLWLLALVAAFFLFIGISTPELRMTYILSQVLYLGGWISLYSLIPDTLRSCNGLRYVGLFLLSILLIIFNYFDNNYFDPQVIQTTKIVFVKSLSLPHVLIEATAVMLGIISLLLSISIKRTDKILSIVLIVMLVLSKFIGSGQAFYNYMSYDYMFFAPFLLSVSIAGLMYFIRRLQP